jgi:trehalose-6-phosphate synthase
MAEAIRTALEMGLREQKARMRSMRETLRNRNIYYWAADLIAALARVRLEKPS